MTLFLLFYVLCVMSTRVDMCDSAAYFAVHKPELLTHLPPTAHLGRIDQSTLPPALTPPLSDEEEIFWTAEAA